MCSARSMAIRSVYCPSPSFQNDRIHLTGDEHRHLVVARTDKNELLEIFDGNGNVWTAEVESLTKRETVARVRESRRVSRPSLELMLGMSMIRIPAFELALEKAVEVGVTRIVPFAAARSNSNPGHRHERWMRIIIEAAKQSKQYYVPQLAAARAFSEVLSLPAASKIIFSERGGGPLKPALVGSPVLYLIGPEGGWTEDELGAARKAGFSLISLGETILKADTAAIAGATIIQYELRR